MNVKVNGEGNVNVNVNEGDRERRGRDGEREEAGGGIQRGALASSGGASAEAETGRRRFTRMERGSARHHYNIKRPKRAGFGGVEEEVGSGRCRSTEARRYRGAEAHKDESIGRFREERSPGGEVVGVVDEGPAHDSTRL